MILKINGAYVSGGYDIKSQLDSIIEETKGVIESKNREERRSKPMRYIMALLGFVGTIAYNAHAHAEDMLPPAMSPIIDSTQITQDIHEHNSKLADGIISSFMTKITDTLLNGIAPREGVIRENTVVWKLNEFLGSTLLSTQDFFHNPQIVSTFSTIWYIVMSFTGILIAKKGFDITKARVLGATTIGGSEFIIRLLASVAMTFLSLDIIHLGIEGSNLVVKTLFKALSNNLVPYEVIEHTTSFSALMWLISYLAMFFILALQYWLRQINIVFVGMITPIANMAWVMDGGAMLGTLIREMVLLLTTPIAHGLILSIGSIIMLEGSNLTGNVFIDGINSVFIGLSTMILMIITPTFLRKFITGSVNPLTWCLKTFGGVKTLPFKILKTFKG